jgi:RNA polymerase sigma factor (sigma-70 family)
MTMTMTPIEEYTEYQYLIPKTINHMKTTYGSISDDMTDELTSVGRKVLWEQIINHPVHDRDPNMNMSVYLIYRLKREYKRTLVKSESYWPWVGDDITMVEYRLEDHRNAPGNELEPDRVAWYRSLRDSLARALETLTSHQRHVLGLLYFSGLDVRSVGNLLGCSHQSIYNIKLRGLARLRTQCSWLWPYMEDLHNV